MKMESFKFEKEDLKIDQERVLTYSKLKCPYGCKYCFAEDIIIDQEKNVSYLSEKQFELLEQLPEEVSLIMLGCDTEFFQSKNSLEVLERVSDLEKDVSVVTKTPLSPEYIGQLKRINDKLEQNGKLFTFSMSLPCLDSAKEWETKTPDPRKRIQTLKDVYEAEIKTLVAIRPLLPTLPDGELKEIVASTKDYCYGYYSGPLYLKDLNDPLLGDISFNNLKIDQTQPHWMPDGNIFYKVEKIGQMELLNSIIKGYNKAMFEGAAEAIKYLKTYKDKNGAV